jgi:hypothetical protein
LQQGLDYLAQVLRTRLALSFGQETAFQSIDDVPQPSLNGAETPYAAFLRDLSLPPSELVVFLLALAPHLRPDLIDAVIAERLPQAGDFPQIGGVRGKQFRGFLPTGETALFLLAGTDLERRLAARHLFSENHLFARRHVLRVDAPEPGEPPMSGRLVLDPEVLDRVTTGRVSRPRLSMDFPAQLLETEMVWDDLVLPDDTMAQIRDLEAWVEHGDTLLDDWGMGRVLKRGYRALFHGAPGTGKTLTASLLGAHTERDVFKVDLSMVVSKFIGETEKNLATLFDKAEHKDWILFFDEADALFGKRTSVRDAHDRYANQEVAYLLQRVEAYDGLVILASNFKSNIDDAFLRRFQSIVHFPRPRVGERRLLWHRAFPDAVTMADDVDLDVLARKYEMTGAAIMNVAQYCCLHALARGTHRITMSDLHHGIQREISKGGKVL